MAKKKSHRIITHAAIEIAGGGASMARALGVTRATVSLWKNKGEIPISRVPAVSDLTGIPKASLRSDYWG